MSNSKCKKILNYELKGVGVGVFPDSGKLNFWKNDRNRTLCLVT